jgi:predicted RNase H-like HicB family nuclease
MTDYPVVVVALAEEDGGGYLAYLPDLPGCMSDGDTRAEALGHAEAAAVEWLDACVAQGRPVPAPGDAAAAAEAREAKLFDALRAMIDANQSADQKIKGLERKLADLIALLSDEASRPRFPVERADRSLQPRRARH